MKIEKQKMREHLNAIMAAPYRAPSEMTPIDFLESFCHLIGDPDSMLREDLMAPVFRTFGENDETFSDEESAGIIDRLTGPDNMSYGQDENGPFFNFKRSYSALVVACLLWRNQQRPFLSVPQLNTINERLRPALTIRQSA